MLAWKHFWPSQLESSMQGRKICIATSRLELRCISHLITFPFTYSNTVPSNLIYLNHCAFVLPTSSSYLEIEVLKSINSRIIIWLGSNLGRSSTKQVELQICIPFRLLWTLSKVSMDEDSMALLGSWSLRGDDCYTKTFIPSWPTEIFIFMSCSRWFIQRGKWLHHLYNLSLKAG